MAWLKLPRMEQTGKAAERWTLRLKILRSERNETKRIAMKQESQTIVRKNQTDENLTFLDAIELVRNFCDQRNWRQFHKPKDLAIGVVTEGAELLDLFRFKSEAEVQSLLDNKHTREMVSDEMADVQFFLLRMSEVTGINLGNALRKKIRKNRSKYPVKRAKGSNLKYNQS